MDKWLMLNVVSGDKIFEFPILPKVSIMELKMNLLGMLDLDMDQFTFFLENYGNIDMEEMNELPLESLELGKTQTLISIQRFFSYLSSLIIKNVFLFLYKFFRCEKTLLFIYFE